MKRRVMTMMLMTALMSSFFAYAAPAQASLTKDITDQYDAAGKKAGLNDEDPQQYVSKIIPRVLELVGTIFVALVIYAGYLRLTSHGEEDRLDKSTKTAVAAMTGLIIVFIAYAVTWFVTSRVYNASVLDPKYEQNDNAPNTLYDARIKLNTF